MSDRHDEDQPKVRVTDRRRVRLDDETAAPEAPSVEEPAVFAAETDEPKDELARARREAADYLEHLQRLKAEFDNYRKRVAREQTRAVELASEGIVARLLEALDDFELALVAAEQKPDFDRFIRGVELVYAKLWDVLKGEGLERIDAVGKPFDPEVHEALFQSEEGEGDPVVADVLRPGYSLRGKVIRPAGVKVTRR